ncbi:hypothetical protein IRJ29_17840 [Salmonella enterica subsp. enterica]|uniref:hypothetical protein n=1 Tax=Salmonella enterica TaxID=28901 RepID=UPI001076C789|nr:hypothetical protein [Salmonella enterica]EAB9157681.1 hypothetical protein [Salmonella enterica subsp. enterica serovar Typhimurium]ECA4267782.1 hypothetical protein [Salmonella enterica subsp. enterica serovar Java]ECL9748145.1 hypothetical protein [Salmonella enterica subsp. enterica serovar Kentucky]EAZ3201477.1 hypothetical protein [Salmonella enterica]EDI9297018.1 hypothetical protein [Salmonella enterica subsp. enterica serovar Java]
MTDTAFSKSLQKEVDPEQYMELKDLDEGSVHAVAREDVICPICKVGGGTFVRASRSEGYNKKAHFRFAGENGEGHHLACDFYGDRLSAEVSQHLIRFTTDRTKYSKVIRKLVCAGLQEGIFTQENMRQMREWFFNKRKESTFEIWLDEEDLGWLEFIAGLRLSHLAWTDSDILPFSPIQATVPGFLWPRAIDRETVRVHQATLQKLRELSVYKRDISSILEHLTKNRGRMILDPVLLEDEIRKTLKLTAFIRENYVEFKTKTVSEKSYAEDKFLAFAALLLFVSGWDIDTAISKFSTIARVREVDDMLAGNFIGLNPYFRYDVASAVKRLQDAWPIEYKKIELHDVEQAMRDMYEKYSQSLRFPVPPLAPLLPDIYITQHQKWEQKQAEIEAMINPDVSNPFVGFDDV